jgi:hypothetical protein
MLEQEYEIEKEFKDIVDDATQDRSLKEYLQEVVDYAQNEFCYYSETTSLYDEYSSDCEEWLDELVEETGLKPWDLFNDWDYAINSQYNKWNVITSMFEEYCRDRLEELDEMED